MNEQPASAHREGAWSGRAPRWGQPAALGLLGLLAAMGCSGGKAAKSELGETMAAALLRGVEAAEKVLAPWPCAAIDEAGPAPALAIEGWKLDGLALVPEGGAPVRVVGFVADAGGDAPETVARLRRAAAAFAEGGAGAVISLGGMGGDAEAIAAGLRALATGGGVSGRLVVIAVPGDLEPLTAHRQAVERLQKEALPVVDGSVVRWLKLTTATIATLPGARHQEQLVAGSGGCAFDDAAVDATLGRLAEAVGVRVLASWAAPRAGAVTSATGDLALRQALDRAKIDLAITGEPTSGGLAVERAGRPGGPTDIAHTGFSDGEPRTPSGGKRRSATALLVKLGRGEWQIQRVELAATTAK